jgi:hypothetical protein
VVTVEQVRVARDASTNTPVVDELSRPQGRATDACLQAGAVSNRGPLLKVVLTRACAPTLAARAQECRERGPPQRYGTR